MKNQHQEQNRRTYETQQKLLCILFALILLCTAAVSIADTEEVTYETSFDQEAMLAHIAQLTANGPRSLFDPAENQLALDYIVSLLEGWGFAEVNRTDVPAYMIQEFITEDPEMTVAQIREIIEAFAKTAKLCRDAGVDGVEVHAVHEGYLRTVIWGAWDVCMKL